MLEILKVHPDEAGERGGDWGRPTSVRGEAIDEGSPMLNEKGLMAPAWPKQYGVGELDTVQQ